MSKNIESKINWQLISKVGMPNKELREYRANCNTVERTFLIRGKTQIGMATTFQDGSGFDTNDCFWENITAWAIIEGF
jgi:hypothetical protein